MMRPFNLAVIIAILSAIALITASAIAYSDAGHTLQAFPFPPPPTITLPNRTAQ